MNALLQEKTYWTVIDGQRWLIHTNGHVAVLRRNEHSPGEKEIGSQMFSDALAIKAVTYPVELLAAFVGQQCPACRDIRTRPCRRCGGQHRIDDACPNCDLVHSCECSECGEDGRVTCECSRNGSIKVGRFGNSDELFDLQLVRIALGDLDSPACAVATIYTDSSATLVLRTSSALGLVMRRSGDAPADTPRLAAEVQG